MECKCFRFELHYWPILTSLWLFFTFIITYIIAVCKEHVSGFLPYISDTGSSPPESCVFSQLLNFGALFMFIVVYTRFKVVEALETSDDQHTKFRRANNISFWLGVVSAIGISNVANFQEFSVPGIHFFGSFLAFGVGTIYFMFQTYIGFKSQYTPKYLSWIRIVLNISFVILYILTSVGSSKSFKEFKGPDQLKWQKEDGGYEWHLCATFTEWLIALVMDLYIMTFVSEHKLVKFEEILFTKSVGESSRGRDKRNRPNGVTA